MKGRRFGIRLDDGTYFAGRDPRTGLVRWSEFPIVQLNHPEAARRRIERMPAELRKRCQAVTVKT